MMHWNLGWGAMMFGGLGMLAFWALLVGLVIWGTRSFGRSDGNFNLLGRNADYQAGRSQLTPLEILQGRYANGEINREEYETIRDHLKST